MAAGPTRDAETIEAESTNDSTTTPSTNSVSRRKMLAATAVGSTTAIAGCAKIFGSDTAAGSGETLHVSVWSGNYGERFENSVVPMFEEEFDVTVQTHRGWDEILANIRQAPDDDPPYDVTVTEGQMYHMGRDEDLFLPLREENVPNLEEAIDFYVDEEEFRTAEYGVPADGAPCTLVYRDDLDAEPDSWGDFSADAVEGSAGIGVDTGFWWYPLHAAAIELDERDGAGELYDDALHDEVFDKLREWNVTSWASSGEDIWQDFDNGVIDVAQWYFDQTEFDIDDLEELSHTTPDVNTGYMNHWCVVDGTDKRETAEEFLNFLMDAEVQSEWSEELPVMFSNENTEYAGDLGEELPGSGEEVEDIVFPDWEYLMEYYDEFSNEFTDIETA
ncbi:ABC transporter substrate-binding protein [Natronococcus wangiae]|uniref:ABC transporter substrate-binding protein n=1 Tax=Natronococcus wangiae TaxID=3068275 RepID=UPI00273EFD6C|nr:extracellular solute-binding protein [Natronococcus sp. AD5]